MLIMDISILSYVLPVDTLSLNAVQPAGYANLKGRTYCKGNLGIEGSLYFGSASNNSGLEIHVALKLKGKNCTYSLYR